ncbi:MAG: hypothetical protein ACREBG_11090 [Pyrinomonadaceae bacterium]
MSKIFHYFAASALVFLVGLSGLDLAQTRPASSTRPAANLLNALPTSDAVALVNVKRVLDEALPKLLSANPAKLAEVNSQVEQFKSRTGLDPRSFDQLALGLRYSYPSAGITKIHTLAIARGNFNASAMAAAGKVAAKGKYREEKYQGRTIYVFAIDQQLRLLGILDVKISELAISVLNTNTLALGDAERVRSAIDAKGISRGNAELIGLASRDANAIVGFGGNMSPKLLQNLRIGNDAIAADLATVRQVYGTVGMSDKNLEMLLAARTINADSARSLSDTVEGLKQFGALFINQLSATKGALARSALGNLKITTQGNELQIRTAVAQSEVAPLIRGL